MARNAYSAAFKAKVVLAVLSGEKELGAIAAAHNLVLLTRCGSLESGIAEVLTYTFFPREHWLKIRTNNGIERINRVIRRRTNAVGCFPDGQSALMLVCARLRSVSASEWDAKTYLNMDRLYELEREQAAQKAADAQVG